MPKHEHGSHYAKEIGKRGISVEVRDNNLEGALKILKKKFVQEGLNRDLRRHEYYEKPSIIKRREKAKAQKREATKGIVKKPYDANKNPRSTGQYNGSINIV